MMTLQTTGTARPAGRWCCTQIAPGGGGSRHTNHPTESARNTAPASPIAGGLPRLKGVAAAPGDGCVLSPAFVDGDTAVAASTPLRRTSLRIRRVLCSTHIASPRLQWSKLKRKGRWVPVEEGGGGGWRGRSALGWNRLRVSVAGGLRHAAGPPRPASRRLRHPELSCQAC